MTDHSDFTVDVYQNEYLPEGAQEVNAIITVTADFAGGAAAQTPPAKAAEVIVVDCSGSMDYPPTKMSAAKQATIAAIDTLRDGVAFGVVAGTHQARMVYPAHERLASADEHTRAEARAAVAGLSPNGGTAIGQWLRLARELLAAHPDAIRHVILLTDGKNEHETPAHLDAAIALATGTFTCDCRGVGTAWVVAELRKVASALLGTVDIVADPDGLEADFRAMTAAAMGKAVADVALRVWTPQQATVRFVKQVMPTVEDLTAKRAPVSAQIGDYPTGAWGEESRDYHICVEVPAANVGEEMLAARVSLTALGPDGAARPLAQGLVRAVWTEDTALSTRINPNVAHYTGQAELAAAIQDGLEARKAGDLDTATAKLGRAVALATTSGNDAVAGLLGKVVDVLDPATGTVRLKAKVADADEMALDTRSTKTVRVGKAAR
ncbi:MAG TPA: VWA domain-containing protein [Streptosporangiaceae bacterium]|nr:VWA domain-containing protein [Streptosporangiaceae bacterium]